MELERLVSLKLILYYYKKKKYLPEPFFHHVRESSLQFDPLHPKVCFLRETFQKMVRYSYYERIKSTIPDEFSSIFPIEPSTSFKYEDSSNIKFLIFALNLCQLDQVLIEYL